MNCSKLNFLFSPRSLLLGMTALLISCDRHLPDKVEIRESRAVFPSEGAVPEPVPASKRLGVRSQSAFRWTAPPGWKLMPTTQMRDLNFSFGPKGEGECYLAMTKGTAGSTIHEVNRWRKQMAAEAIDEAAVAALPTLKLFNRDCPHVLLEGTYSPASGMAMGMGGPPSVPRPDYGMSGVILEVPVMEAVITIKMVGPKDLVKAEQENFKAFITSLSQGAE